MVSGPSSSGELGWLGHELSSRKLKPAEVWTTWGQFAPFSRPGPVSHVSDVSGPPSLSTTTFQHHDTYFGDGYARVGGDEKPLTPLTALTALSDGRMGSAS